MTKKTEKKLLEIATKHCVAMQERGDFEVRNWDGADFFEVAVWEVKTMLEQAFEAGKRSK